MRRLIKADLRRILLKLGFYILPGILVILNFVDLSSKDIGFEDLYTTMSMTYSYIAGYFVCIPVFLAVYADELRSGALVIAIGRGMSRKKVVAAKFLDVVILTILLYIILFSLDLFNFAYYMVNPTALQMERAILLVVAAMLKAIGAMGFASIFVYLTWNSSVGIVVELIALGFSGVALGWIQDNFRIPVLDISLIGQVDQACANFAAGKNWLLPSAAVLFYLAIFVLISMLVFNRKELEL